MLLAAYIELLTKAHASATWKPLRASSATSRPAPHNFIIVPVRNCRLMRSSGCTSNLQTVLILLFVLFRGSAFFIKTYKSDLEQSKVNLRVEGQRYIPIIGDRPFTRCFWCRFSWVLWEEATNINGCINCSTESSMVSSVSSQFSSNEFFYQGRLS